jgi:hypothetical protein
MTLSKARKQYVGRESEVAVDRLVVAILEALQRCWGSTRVFEDALAELSQLDQEEWLPVVARMEESYRYMQLANERTGEPRKRYVAELKRRGLS